jgi:hypothetical protein
MIIEGAIKGVAFLAINALLAFIYVPLGWGFLKWAYSAIGAFWGIW